MTLAPFGGVAVPGPYTRVTLAPAETNSEAKNTPVLPVLRFVITRTGSMYSIVGPAVIRILFLCRVDEYPNFFNTNSKTSSGSAALAFPSIMFGATKSILFLRKSIFFFTALL